MNAGSDRDRVLGRVRAAVASRDWVGHPGALAAWPEDADGPIDAFRKRFTASGGEVVFLPDAEAVEEWVRDFGRHFDSMAVGRGLPDRWLPELERLDPADAELGVSRAVAAAADTGTVILDGREGRRVQLLPPVHLVWVAAGTIHSRLAEAMGAAGRGSAASVVALHSGPSKSADIGRITVTGVHGPGRVVVAVVGVGARA